MARHKPKFKSVEEVKQIIDKYLEKYPLIRTAKTEVEEAQARINATNGILPTLTGASLELGLLGIDEFIYYAKKAKYKLVFQEVRSRLQEYYEQGLATGKGSQGVTMWLDRVGKGFEQNQPLNANGQPLLNVLVISSDGNKIPLQSLINTPKVIEAQPPQPQAIPHFAQDSAPTQLTPKGKQEKTPRKPKTKARKPRKSKA